MFRYLFWLFFGLIQGQLYAQPKQFIYGQVVDESSHLPIGYAVIEVFSAASLLQAVADSAGNYAIQVPVGRISIQANAVGYVTAKFADIIVISGKEKQLDIPLLQIVNDLSEIVIRSNRNTPVNTMATVSAKTLSVEDAKRFAGGFDDPARLATSFAGVASNTNDNGIIVRGNAPKFLQWKMEGVEIPNPNHFADLKVIGGGTLTALSSQMLGNSDFFSGAFPAEYNNALSGIFDMKLRTGNTRRKEYTFQTGIIGIDASAEGPFKDNGTASYLFNYRYSTLALLSPLLPDNAGSLRYQDLSFKLNFPTKKMGTFSVWGFGLLDKAGAEAKTDSTEWKYANDKQQDKIKLFVGVAGLKHTLFFRNDSYLKTTLSYTANNTLWNTNTLNENRILMPYSNINNKTTNYILSSSLNRKFGTRHTNRTGILFTGMEYNLLLDRQLSLNPNLQTIVNAKGFSTLLSAYSTSAVQLSTNSVVNIGINAQYFTLNSHYSIEPRLGLRHQLSQNHSIALAYGLHSRIEKLSFYLNNNLLTGEIATNKELDFTKAHHIVLGYDWSINNTLHLKVEPYFQYLFSVPVIADSSFSLLNLQGDWFFADKLINAGKGKNYGIDVSLDKSFLHNYYYLISASLFNTIYKGGDMVWYNTRYNRNFIINALGGKEWQTGVNHQNVWAVNLRLTYQGGNRYSPVNTQETMLQKSVVSDETKAYSQQANPVLNIHFTASYKINRKNTTHEIALKILNLTRQPDFYGYKYNQLSRVVDEDLSSVTIPNLSYRIEF